MYLLVQVLTNLFQIWQILLFIWVILSWIPQVPRNHPAVELVGRVIEPTLAPFRRLMPMGGIDISPIIAYFVYSIALRAIISLLANIS
ncbi:YggT family protein [bacterium]|nr:YggT family protein [bacterium]